MLETSLIIFILLSVVFFIIDYSQSMFTRNMVEETVHQVGRKVAVIPNLDVDYRRLRPSNPRYRRALHSRRMAIETGEKLLRQVFPSDYEGGEQPVFLNQLTQTFPSFEGESQTIEAPIAILVAGECARKKDGTAICNTQPFGGDDSEDFPAANAHLGLLASEFPVRVVVDVELPSILGILPTHKFQVQTYVYRDSVPESPFSQEIEDELGNPPLAAPGSKEPPNFGRPIIEESPPPNWRSCISQNTGLPMTEAEMAESLVRCSTQQATNGRPCYFEGCRAMPK